MFLSKTLTISDSLLDPNYICLSMILPLYKAISHSLCITLLLCLSFPLFYTIHLSLSLSLSFYLFLSLLPSNIPTIFYISLYIKLKHLFLFRLCTLYLSMFALHSLNLPNVMLAFSSTMCVHTSQRTQFFPVYAYTFPELGTS